MEFMFFFFVFTKIRYYSIFFFFSSRRRHTRSKRDWSSDVCSSDLEMQRLRVHRQCREQHIVHLGDSARHRMLEHLSFGELLEIETRHPSPPADYWPPIIGP